METLDYIASDNVIVVVCGSYFKCTSLNVY